MGRDTKKMNLNVADDYLRRGLNELDVQQYWITFMESTCQGTDIRKTRQEECILLITMLLYVSPAFPFLCQSSEIHKAVPSKPGICTLKHWEEQGALGNFQDGDNKHL
jgi:hypothetical protein